MSEEVDYVRHGQRMFFEESGGEGVEWRRERR